MIKNILDFSKGNKSEKYSTSEERRNRVIAQSEDLCMKTMINII